MHIRWFGHPWGREDKRAPICEDDRYKVDVPVGTKCLLCNKRIEERDSGIITACSPSIFGHWKLKIRATTDDQIRGAAGPIEVSVCSYHMFCWIKETIGSEELTEKILSKMNFRVDEAERPVPADSPDEIPAADVDWENAEVKPGRGWRRE